MRDRERREKHVQRETRKNAEKERHKVAQIRTKTITTDCHTHTYSKTYTHREKTSSLSVNKPFVLGGLSSPESRVTLRWTRVHKEIRDHRPEIVGHPCAPDHGVRPVGTMRGQIFTHRTHQEGVRLPDVSPCHLYRNPPLDHTHVHAVWDRLAMLCSVPDISEFPIHDGPFDVWTSTTTLLFATFGLVDTKCPWTMHSILAWKLKTRVMNFICWSSTWKALTWWPNQSTNHDPLRIKREHHGSSKETLQLTATSELARMTTLHRNWKLRIVLLTLVSLDGDLAASMVSAPKYARFTDGTVSIVRSRESQVAHRICTSGANTCVNDALEMYESQLLISHVGTRQRSWWGVVVLMRKTNLWENETHMCSGWNHSHSCGSSQTCGGRHSRIWRNFADPAYGVWVQESASHVNKKFGLLICVGGGCRSRPKFVRTLRHLAPLDCNRIAHHWILMSSANVSDTRVDLILKKKAVHTSPADVERFSRAHYASACTTGGATHPLGDTSEEQRPQKAEKASCVAISLQRVSRVPSSTIKGMDRSGKIGMCSAPRCVVQKHFPTVDPSVSAPSRWRCKRTSRSTVCPSIVLPASCVMFDQNPQISSKHPDGCVGTQTSQAKAIGLACRACFGSIFQLKTLSNSEPKLLNTFTLSGTPSTCLASCPAARSSQSTLVRTAAKVSPNFLADQSGDLTRRGWISSAASLLHWATERSGGTAQIWFMSDLRVCLMKVMCASFFKLAVEFLRHRTWYFKQFRIWQKGSPVSRSLAYLPWQCAAKYVRRTLHQQTSACLWFLTPDQFWIKRSRLPQRWGACASTAPQWRIQVYPTFRSHYSLNFRAAADEAASVLPSAAHSQRGVPRQHANVPLCACSSGCPQQLRLCVRRPSPQPAFSPRHWLLLDLLVFWNLQDRFPTSCTKEPRLHLPWNSRSAVSSWCHRRQHDRKQVSVPLSKGRMTNPVQKTLGMDRPRSPRSRRMCNHTSSEPRRRQRPRPWPPSGRSSVRSTIPMTTCPSSCKINVSPTHASAFFFAQMKKIFGSPMSTLSSIPSSSWSAQSSSRSLGTATL